MAKAVVPANPVELEVCLEFCPYNRHQWVTMFLQKQYVLYHNDYCSTTFTIRTMLRSVMDLSRTPSKGLPSYSFGVDGRGWVAFTGRFLDDTLRLKGKVPSFPVLLDYFKSFILEVLSFIDVRNEFW